ncbi:MAG: ABC transporter ATP-binding protein [Ruminiclostridium sp.]|nr:ABC transporter ATP-binding protein [Ruminiclostridium sp.]
MIELNNIQLSFDDNKILDGVTMTIPDGRAFGLLGSNGAGKSTILRLLSGIYRVQGGTLKIDGEDVYDNVKIKEQICFINDETIQFTGYTLKQLKNYYKRFYRTFSEEKFEKLHSVLNLPMNKKLSAFSKGMKRQAIVICAIACCTKYIFLDEAFDGLDPTMRIIVKNMMIDAMIDNGATVILSSHNLKEIQEFCDTAALLHNGKIVFCRELDSIMGNIRKVQTSFAAAPNKEDFPEIEILHIENTGSVTSIIAKGSEEEIRTAIEKHNPKFLDIIPLTLDEIFIYEMEGQGYDGKSL